MPGGHHPHQVQGEVGLVGLVKRQQVTQVGAGQYIPVEHHHGVVPQLARDVGDAAAGPQRDLLGHVVDLQAQFGTVTELGLEHRSLI